MASVFSGTNQGSFTSTGAAKLLNIRSNVDWMYVYNQTQIALVPQAGSTGLQYYWQRGMAPGTGIRYSSGAANGPTVLASFFGTTTGTGSLGNDYAGTV